MKTATVRLPDAPIGRDFSNDLGVLGRRNPEFLLLLLSAAIIFSLANFAFPHRIDQTHLGLHIGAFLALHVIFRFRLALGTQVILPILYTLTGAGLLLQSFFLDARAGTVLYNSYLTGVLAGCTAFAIFALMPRIDRLADFKYLSIVTAIILAALLVVFGRGPRGTDAKINLFGFQPAEAIKLLVVLFLAAYFSDRDVELRRLHAFEWGWLRLPRFRDAFPVLITVGSLLALFFLQRDLGPALILYLLFLGSFVAVSRRYTLGLGGLVVLLGAFAVSYRWGFLATVRTRIEMWLHPWDNHRANGIQLAESLWSVSSGAWHGMWSHASVGYLPAGHTDLVLASVGEVFGISGFLVLFGLLMVMFSNAVASAFRAATAFDAWFAYGLALLLGIQTVFMAAATLGLLPLSGLPVPFLSYGKSATIAGFSLAGLLLNISSVRKERSVRRFLPGAAWIMPVIVLAGAILCGLRAGQVMLLSADALICRGALTPQADGVRRYVYNRRLLDVAAKIRRGDIVDRNGIPIATNDPARAKSATDSLLRAGLSAASQSSNSSRYYPLGPSAVHILGHTGAYWTDPRTIEKSGDTKLRGYSNPARITQVDGHRVASYDYSALVPIFRDWEQGGNKLIRIASQDRSFRTTLDARFQEAASAALVSTLAALPGKAATNAAAVVLNAATGRILASVSLPTYDPNRISLDDLERIYDAPEKAGLDRARFEVYPPGSSFKIVTAAAALESLDQLPAYHCMHRNKIDWMDGVVHRSRIVADDATDLPHGLIDLDQAIVESCNVYFASLGVEIGAQRLYNMASRMHLELTGIHNAVQMSRDLADNAYGQGRITVSPLRMAAVAAAVANGGVYAEPYVDASASPVTKQIVSPDVAQHLQKAMLGVVQRGTGRGVFISGLMIGGKTGTAQTSSGGAASDSWFIGFACPQGAGPDQMIAFAFFVEHGGYGARAAAPAAKAFLSAYARMNSVQEAPTYGAEEQQ